MTQLVGKHGNDLIDLALLDQGVVDDNLLAPGQSVEVSIAVGTALGTVDNVKVLQGEVEPGGQCFNLGLELSILKRSELVEQRQDEDRVDGDQEGLHSKDEQPKVVEEVATKVANDLQETSKNWRTEASDQKLCPEGIREKLHLS